MKMFRVEGVLSEDGKFKYGHIFIAGESVENIMHQCRKFGLIAIDPKRPIIEEIYNHADKQR